MPHEIDMEKAQREEARWRILKALDAGRPFPVPETLILNVLQDINLQITVNGLRREMDYLSDRGLITITDRRGPVWSGDLTREGVDFVEYTIDAQPGIARPNKWY